MAGEGRGRRGAAGRQDDDHNDDHNHDHDGGESRGGHGDDHGDNEHDHGKGQHGHGGHGRAGHGHEDDGRDEHPVLDPDADATARGGESPGSIGAFPEPPDTTPTGTGPDTQLPGKLQSAFADISKGRHPARQDLPLPFLLIRSYPGDRGIRPMAYPPTVAWESPDILLNESTAPPGQPQPFDRAKLVTTPVAGAKYRVYVHVWNLADAPAYGVSVCVWWVDPGFFGPGQVHFPMHLIGQAMVPALPGRSRGRECHQLVEIPTPWEVVNNNDGHECLLAVAECFTDRSTSHFDVWHDRHVGQHNLTIAAGSTNLAPLLKGLGQMLPLGADLQLLLGKEAARPILEVKFPAAAHAVVSGDAGGAESGGVPTPVGQHLATVTRTAEGAALVPSKVALGGDRQLSPALLGVLPAAVRGHADRTGSDDRAERDRHGGGHRCNDGRDGHEGHPGHGGDHQEGPATGGVVQAASMDELPQLLATWLKVPNLRASTVLKALGGSRDDPQVLRMFATSGTEVIGGYTLIVTDPSD